MQDILFQFELNPTTWAYISTLLTIGIYFKFRRIWSVRNLDLIGLIAFSPGLLMLYHGTIDYDTMQLRLLPLLVRSGYVWLFCVSAFFLIRLLLDPVMVRRPLLEPNLSASGLTFTGICLLIFLTANVFNPRSAHRLEDLVQPPELGQPGYAPFYAFAGAGEVPADAEEAPRPQLHQRGGTATQTVAILAHLAVVIGIVVIGYRHFDNIHTGVAATSLYLLLLYTSQMVGRVDHAVPAALLVWTVAAYRRPIVAGLLLGLAVGLIYYPIWLLPLWCGFYWRRGLVRFSVSLLITLLLMVLVLFFLSADGGRFLADLLLMFGWKNPLQSSLSGFWSDHEAVFRLPVLAAFIALSISLALWPAQKNLGTLLACSAAVMLGTQFWQAHSGGLYMNWYLPLLLLTIFRPNLEDRVALSAVGEGWFRRKGSP